MDASTGEYDCLAANKVNDDGTVSGYEYSATINYDDFTFSWELGD